jgi:hypothetical protein
LPVSQRGGAAAKKEKKMRGGNRQSASSAKQARPSKVRVVVRVRPSIAEDIDIGYQTLGDQYSECVHEDADHGTVQLRKPFFDTREFSLDVVLGRKATQYARACTDRLRPTAAS